MHPGTAPTQPVGRVGDHGPEPVDLGRHHSQQDGPVSALPTSQTHPLRLPSGTVGRVGLPDRATGLCQSSPTAGRFIPQRLALRLSSSRSRSRRGHPIPLRAQPGPARSASGRVRPPPAASASPSVSARMSIRQPVSLAASRAFWPSLPIARDSW
jgi:hypothetical protein